MSDKRSVATDALETLGTAPIPEDSGRDAIHLAVEPAVAGISLAPGQRVGLMGGTAMPEHLCDKALGIVDPFLGRELNPGEKFWLVVFPRQIASLRHVWSHPDFPEESPVSQDVARKLGIKQAEIVLKNFAVDLDCSLEELIENARAYQRYDGYWSEGGRFEGVRMPAEFWKCFAIYTGEDVRVQGSFFSCAC